MYNFTEDQIARWKDFSRVYKGTNDTAVIFVHGWSTMSRRLVPMAKTFNKAGYHVSIPLLKGHGSRPENLEKIEWEEWLKDVVDAIEDVKKNKSIKYIFAVGSSAGGNLAILANLKTKIDGIVFIGTPVHLRNHFWIWITARTLPLFGKKYVRKGYYPKNVKKESFVAYNSYGYIPIKSVRENFKLIKKSVAMLEKTKIPALVLQTNNDYLVTKYSPWIIYKKIASNIKKIQWIKSEHDSHVPLPEEVNDYFQVIDSFIKEIKNN